MRRKKKEIREDNTFWNDREVAAAAAAAAVEKECHVECYVYVKHSGVLCLHKLR